MGVIYFDNSATTKPCDTAIKYIHRALSENYANPSSLYGMGAQAEMLLSDTREAVAKALGCSATEVFFTSCGTESNNTAIIGGAHSRKKRGNRIVSTQIEHPSVLNALKLLEAQGFEVVLIPPEADGNINFNRICEAVTADTILITMMAVNNETGAILPIDKINKAVKAVNAPALIHCDASQAFGKMPINPAALGIDLLTVSGHKIHAPKGVGVLYKSKKVHIEPLLLGGGQEQGLRSGTEPMPAIAGLYGALCELNIPAHSKAVSQLSQYARDRLCNIDGVVINSPKNALPYILNVSVVGYRSETALHFLESKNILVSSGSACAKGHKSHVLAAMGLDNKLIDSALRISFSHFNTKADVDALVAAIAEIPHKLRRSQ